MRPGEHTRLIAVPPRPDIKTDEHTYSDDGEHTWAVPDLWRAAASIEPVLTPLSEIADIDTLLDSTCWSDGPMTVREIIEHGDRIANADLNYPVILTPNGSVADGVHRIVRALREKKAAILAVRLAVMPEPRD